MKLDQCNKTIQAFSEAIAQPIKGKTRYLTGVDLGTAYVVLAVVDETGTPVAGAYEFADVVRDGMVVDYMGAVDIVSRLKENIEQQLGEELELAACAIPPDTALTDAGAVKNVCESAGFTVVGVTDEPTAANYLLQLEEGAIVDIGGGTTGVARVRDGRIVETWDEPTGGTHFSLVLAGAKKISFQEAEDMKKDAANHTAIFPVLKPVIDKISTIVSRRLDKDPVGQVVLVGGTSTLTGMEQHLAAQLGTNVDKPELPMFVTPLGIALFALQEWKEKGDDVWKYE